MFLNTLRREVGREKYEELAINCLGLFPWAFKEGVVALNLYIVFAITEAPDSGLESHLSTHWSLPNQINNLIIISSFFFKASFIGLSFTIKSALLRFYLFIINVFSSTGSSPFLGCNLYSSLSLGMYLHTAWAPVYYIWSLIDYNLEWQFHIRC